MDVSAGLEVRVMLEIEKSSYASLRSNVFLLGRPLRSDWSASTPPCTRPRQQMVCHEKGEA